MIVAPKTMAAAITEIDRAISRLNDYRTQLDNATDMLRAAGQLTARLGTELREYQRELDATRKELDAARRLITELRTAVETLTAERDTWRAQASAGSR